MSGLQNFKFESLREDDRPAVVGWLEGHLVQHMKWWSEQIGPSWSDEHIREHLREHQLVEKEWAGTLDRFVKEDRFVTVARSLGR